MSVAEAAEWADVLMMLTPDELQAEIYKNEIAEKIRVLERRCCSPMASMFISP